MGGSRQKVGTGDRPAGQLRNQLKPRPPLASSRAATTLPILSPRTEALQYQLKFLLKPEADRLRDSVNARGWGDDSDAQEMREKQDKHRAEERRMRYFGSLQDATSKVESMTEQLVRPVGETFELLHSTSSLANLDLATELALSKNRVQKLLGSLHLESSMEELQGVVGWLDQSVDHSGEGELSYSLAEQESQEMASTLSVAVDEVNEGLDGRNELASERLGAFGESLSAYTKWRRRRNIEQERDAVASVTSDELDPMRLELDAGLLRTELQDAEQQLHGSTCSSEDRPISSGSASAFDRANQMRGVIAKQSLQLADLRVQNEQLDGMILTAQERIAGLRSDMSRRKPQLRVLLSEVDSYLLLRTTEAAEVEAEFQLFLEQLVADQAIALRAAEAADSRTAARQREMEALRSLVADLERTGTDEVCHAQLHVSTCHAPATLRACH